MSAQKQSPRTRGTGARGPPIECCGGGWKMDSPAGYLAARGLVPCHRQPSYAVPVAASARRFDSRRVGVRHLGRPEFTPRMARRGVIWQFLGFR
jgi:hypothetical protein